MTEKKILVVDDEVFILDLLNIAFSRAGFAVRTAENAQEALQILKGENINVMFLDLNLPEMNGVELCAKIRKNQPNAIIHAVTGYAPYFEPSDYKMAGFDGYFTKPVKLKTLLRAARDAHA